MHGAPGYEHHIIARIDEVIVFLSKYPVAWGHVLVAPVEHVEQVITDLAPERFLSLMQIVHSVGVALTALVPTERLYVLSLGSNEGNAHVHWHLVPLPPGVPYEEQQTALFDPAKGWLHYDADELSRLAVSIARRLPSGP